MDKVEHFEIPTDDIKRAGFFYTNVFGWDIIDASIKDMMYHMAYTSEIDKDSMPKEKGVINGALFVRSEAKETPIVVITVENMEETLKKVENNGGKIIMKPQKITDRGLYARIKDSEDNVIGIWQHIKQ